MLTSIIELNLTSMILVWPEKQMENTITFYEMKPELKKSIGRCVAVKKKHAELTLWEKKLIGDHFMASESTDGVWMSLCYPVILNKTKN